MLLYIRNDMDIKRRNRNFRQTLLHRDLSCVKSTISLFISTGNIQGESSIGLTLFTNRTSNILTHITSCT